MHLAVYTGVSGVSQCGSINKTEKKNRTKTEFQHALLLHDNAQAHKLTTVTIVQWEKINVLPYPPYSRHRRIALSPSFHN